MAPRARAVGLGDPGPAAAVEEWGRIPDDAPEGASSRLYRGLAEFFTETGGYLGGKAALPHLERLASHPGREGRLARAVIEILARRWEGARRLLRNEVGWESSLLRAYVEGRDPGGDRAQCLREYESALSQGIPFAWARRSCGLARTQLGDWTGALEDFTTALRMDPDSAASKIDRAATYQRLGDFASALADLDAVLRAQPGDPMVLAYRGEAHRRLGRLREALEDCEAALRLAPTHFEALVTRSNLRADAGDLPRALEDLDRALAVRPEDPEALVNRGVVRGQAGDHDGAIQDYTSALRVMPEHLTALKNRLVERIKTADEAGAEADLEAFERLHPGAPEGSALRGILLEIRGDWAGAIREYGRFLHSQPKPSSRDEFQRRIADCRRQLAGTAPRASDGR